MPRILKRITFGHRVADITAHIFLYKDLRAISDYN